LELVDLPTEFDPDAEPAPIARRSSVESNDVEDTLQVPIRSIEDEDAEEARQLAELDKRRNPPQEEGDEDEENLEELLRGLQGDEEEGEGGDDEILAEMPVDEEEPDIVLGQETVPPAVEDSSQAEVAVQQEQEDVQMDSSKFSVLRAQRSRYASTKESADRSSILITFIRLARLTYRASAIATATASEPISDNAQADTLASSRISRRIIDNRCQASQTSLG
jgi:hypothetical protein